MEPKEEAKLVKRIQKLEIRSARLSKEIDSLKARQNQANGRINRRVTRADLRRASRL